MPLAPALIQNFRTEKESLTPLELISLDRPPYNEEWLQNLIHLHPQLVSAGAIEPSFDAIIPVVRELPLPSGYLDNLYITPDGYPVLVEVKLWKNQEARRKVVAQILEYAKDFTTLKYETLNAEIRKLVRNQQWGENPLYEIAQAGTPTALDEAAFIDRVTRNMREGRFLLLILGDGIREDMENLANYLLHHSLRYAFGIVQIRLFTLPDGNILALPDVMMKTQTIERHVTVVTTQGAGVSVSEVVAPRAVVERTEKTSISLDGFYETVQAIAPENVAFFKQLIQILEDTVIEPQVTNTGVGISLKATLGSGDSATMMYLTPVKVEFWGLPLKLKASLKGQQVARTYLERLATLIEGASIKEFETGSMDIKSFGKSVPVTALAGKIPALLEIMVQAIQQTTELEIMG